MVVISLAPATTHGDLGRIPGSNELCQAKQGLLHVTFAGLRTKYLVRHIDSCYEIVVGKLNFLLLQLPSTEDDYHACY